MRLGWITLPFVILAGCTSNDTARIVTTQLEAVETKRPSEMYVGETRYDSSVLICSEGRVYLYNQSGADTFKEYSNRNTVRILRSEDGFHVSLPKTHLSVPAEGHCLADEWMSRFFGVLLPVKTVRVVE